MKARLIMSTACAALLILAGQSAPAQDQLRNAVKAQTNSLNASAEVQNRINELDDDARESLNEYRQALSQVDDLLAYNQQLESLVAAQSVELADFERRFQALETTKRQILPLILRMLEVLDEFVQVDMPFLAKERAMRIKNLNELMARPDVPTSEKYRRVTEAYQIELEYGHTIEGYEGEIEIGGETRTVAFLRYGRLGLYYMTLNGLEIGYWDKSADGWVELPSEDRQAMDQAMRIARKQLPPNLTRLPVPAPEDRT